MRRQMTTLLASGLLLAAASACPAQDVIGSVHPVSEGFNHPGQELVGDGVHPVTEGFNHPGQEFVGDGVHPVTHGPNHAAHEFVADGAHPVPVTFGFNHCPRRGCSCRRIWEWLTYRPLRAPRACKIRRIERDYTPPLYTYFLGEFGPRSPGLGYMVPHHEDAIPVHPDVVGDHDSIPLHSSVPVQDANQFHDTVPVQGSAVAPDAVPVQGHAVSGADDDPVVPVHDLPARNGE